MLERHHFRNLTILHLQSGLHILLAKYHYMQYHLWLNSREKSAVTGFGSCRFYGTR